jgi:hypothetical protein
VRDNLYLSELYAYLLRRGYGCLDHFLEGKLLCELHKHLPKCRTGDTVLHSWEVLAKILSSDITMNIVCDIGMYALACGYPCVPC